MQLKVRSSLCPVVARNGSATGVSRLPVSGAKRTSQTWLLTSGFDPQRTSQLQIDDDWYVVAETVAAPIIDAANAEIAQVFQPRFWNENVVDNAVKRVSDSAKLAI